MSKKAPVPNLGDFEISMPTPKELRASSLKQMKLLKPVLIDQWPEGVSRLSMPTKLIRVDAKAFIDAYSAIEGREKRGTHIYFNELAAELDAAMGWDRKFIRLSSRSPKDAPWPFEVPATISGKEAVHILMSSMRAFDDLAMFRHVPEYPCFVALRDFDPGISPSAEFRCFVKDRELIAVTHYDYLNPTPEWVVDQAKETRQLIERFFVERLKPALHIDTVVFDFAITGSGKIVLIELNPYGLSDPCHFKSYDRVEAATSHIEVSRQPLSKATGE